MKVLGFEGTAHTAGVGIVETDPADPDRCVVLANRVDMHRPETGGIHPREAAQHHVETLPGLLRSALEDADCTLDGLDGIAFSQGPGLGPCLRTVATVARALALRHDLPLAGVNHCVAHLEIGRAMTDAVDPVMLYASGGNTQVIAEARGRYRVFGETLDIGIGNALDKFARGHGVAFPGGPRIEKLAEEGARMLEGSGGGPEALPELPYSVKGMDVSFSGFLSAADQLIRDGTPLEVACHAFQEWAYAMLVETTERAMAHAGKDEVLLGGGVGRNLRLQKMLADMAEARGASFHVPAAPLLSDNGAMIAWNGLLAIRAGHAVPPEGSPVDQTYRTDAVDLVWRAPAARATQAVPPDPLVSGATGAEAEVVPASFLGRPVMVKRRHPKTYRHSRIERRLVSARVRHEVQVLGEAWTAGVRVPRVLDADPSEGTLVMETVPGPTVKAVLRSAAGAGEAGLEGTGSSTAFVSMFADIGTQVARLHDAGLVHGDLTTSNLVLDAQKRPVLIDFGLAEKTVEREPRAVDLHVLQEALTSSHGGAGPLWEAFYASYRATAPDAKGVVHRFEDLIARGRYRSMTG